MQIQVDTREHKEEWTRIKKQFDSLGVTYFRSKMFVGDYCNVDNPRLCIDRKKNLQELCGNVCQQHERFKSELIRAKDNGFKLIILVEHGNGIECMEDVYFWQNPRRREHPRAVNGDQLYKSLCTIEKEYGVVFAFCNKLHTGQTIVDILKGGGP